MRSFPVRLASGQGRAKAGEQVGQAGAYLASGLPAHVAPGQEQQVGPAGRIAPVPENLSRDSPDAAASHRAPCGPPQGEDQLPVGPSGAVPAEGPWASARAHAVPPKADRRCLASGLPHPADLHAQAVPPLRPPPAQDLPPIRRAHPLEEAVAALPLALVRLIRPFHCSSLVSDKVAIILPSPSPCQVSAERSRRRPHLERSSDFSGVSPRRSLLLLACLRSYAIRDDSRVGGLATIFLHKSPYNYLILITNSTYPHVWKSLCVTRPIWSWGLTSREGLRHPGGGSRGAAPERVRLVDQRKCPPGAWRHTVGRAWQVRSPHTRPLEGAIKRPGLVRDCSLGGPAQHLA